MPAFAQTAAPATDAAAVPTIAELQKEIEKIEQSKDMDDATKSPILALYREAVQDLILAETLTAKTRDFEQLTGSAADEIKVAKAKLAEDAALAMPTIAEDAPLGELEKLLGEAEKNLATVNDILADAETEPRRRAIRRLEIETLLKQARDRLTSLEKQQKTPPAEKAGSPQEIARRKRLSAALSAAHKEVEGYAKELAAYEATTELLPLSLDLASREAAKVKKTVKLLQGLVARARQLEAESQIRQAKLEAAMADPSLRHYAKDNQEIAEERRELIDKIKRDNETLGETRSTLNDIKRQYSRAQNQLERIGRNEAVTLLPKQPLPSTRPYADAIEARRGTIDDCQTRIIELADLRKKIMAEEEQLAAIPSEVDAEQNEHNQAVREFLNTQKQYVDLLSKECYRRLDLLVELNTTQQELVDEITEYQSFIDEQVLWIRSATPIWDISSWPSLIGFKAFFEADFLTAPAESLMSDFRKFPLAWIAAVLAIGLLIYGRRDAKPALREIGEKAAASGMQHFWPTVQATLLTALLAAPALGALAFIAWRMSTISDIPAPTRAMAAGLLVTALVYIPVEFFRQVCRPHGLAECHFGWPAAAVSRMHRSFSRLIAPTFPLLAAAAAMGRFDELRWQNSLGRMSFIAAMFVTAATMHFLLRKRGEVFRAFLAQQPAGWFPRAFRGGWLFMVVFPLMLCVIAALGYYFTAWRLASRWLATVLTAQALLFCGAFFLRWILIIRRRMTMERARLQREEAQKAEAAAAGPTSPPAPPKPAADLGPDLETINLQARRLVFIILGVLSVCSLWIIWNDVLPALGIFKEVTLWNAELQAPQGGVAIYRPVSIADLAWATLVLSLALVAARNIPGLLEISILQQFPIDKGLRFAITTVCRYILVGIGIVYAFNYIGLSWGKVQWILAAISVGLGFGLQEIFANFVSGMVILFERPIRIGDIITIGNASGKVLRIQMRATTILDWDKKELVVPNKEFTTGRLLNWTLTDTLNRLVFDVMVSYKHDPDQVRALLLKIAAEHPKVIDSPKPICICRDFTPNGMHFSLRIYLATMKGRLLTIHEMHSRIHKAFREAGIEIAYPQLDLHVRSGLHGPERMQLGEVDVIEVLPEDGGAGSG